MLHITTPHMAYDQRFIVNALLIHTTWPVTGRFLSHLYYSLGNYL